MEQDQQAELFDQAIRLFNTGEFFACHDVLEEVWAETLGPERAFLQGLIHAAVSLFHFGEGNLAGARKMHDSACRYLAPCGPACGGIDLARFRVDFDACLAPLLGPWRDYPQDVFLDESKLPKLHFIKAGN